MGGIKPLVQLLESSQESVQAQAAFALMEISNANQPNQQAVVSVGGIQQLAGLMKSSRNAAVNAEVAGALWALSESSENKIAIAQASAIQPLVQLLGSGDQRATEHAAAALGSLAFDNDENQVHTAQLLIELLHTGIPPHPEVAQERAAKALWALVQSNPKTHSLIAKAGDPEKLVALLETSVPDAKEYAVWSLSLSINAENQAAVAEAGGVQPLIDMLFDSRTNIQEETAQAIAKLAHDNDETRVAVTKQGGVKPLIALLSAKSSETLLQNATNALANLAVEPAARDEIVHDKGIAPLVTLLKEAGGANKYAAMVLARLCKEHDATQIAIAQAGAIEPLVNLLAGSEGVEAQQEAAGALFELANHANNRQGITAAGGIPGLVNLLACENPRAREHAEGALVRLSIEDENRVMIIKKLVDMLNNTDTQAQEQAAAALANLARESEDNRKSIVDANGIPPLLFLLESQSSKAKENSVGAITELCRKSKANQAAIAKVGGIPKLVSVLVGFSAAAFKEPSLAQLCTLAADAVKEMAEDNKVNQNAIAESGAIPPLVAMLGSGVADAARLKQMQANAAGALANLAKNNAENQQQIARTGAIAPLCTLVREGSEEAKDHSAHAIWTLATDNAANKDTIAKLGGIDPLLGLLVTGLTERSQECVAGALAALAAKHIDNRGVIAKRLVGLLGMAASRGAPVAVRVLMAVSSFASESVANQVALAKSGVIPPLITWLANASTSAQQAAANAMLCLAVDNTTTQVLIAKSNGIPPLINLVKARGSTPAAQDYAARALFHIGSQAENQSVIAECGAVKPLVGMLSAEADQAAELAAIVLLRLTRGTSGVAIAIASAGGILPLVQLLSSGTPGAQQQAASALAELALVPSNRDLIASAGGIQPLIILLTSATVHTPETAARTLARLALEDDDDGGNESLTKQLKSTVGDDVVGMGDGFGGDKEGDRGREGAGKPEGDKGVRGAKPGLGRSASKVHVGTAKKGDGSFASGTDAAGGGGDEKEDEVAASPSKSLDRTVNGSEERRAMINQNGGVKRLISMLDGSNLAGKATSGLKGIGLQTDSVQVGMAEQAAAALADVAYNSAEMQDAVIEAGGVPCLLSFIRTASPLGQEHAARAIRNLAAQPDSQATLVECGTIPELVQLTKTGSQKAQVVAAAGLSDLARGALLEEELKKTRRKKLSPEAAAALVLDGGNLDDAEKDQSTSRLELISEAGGIIPLVSMLSSTNPVARENAASSLMHLANHPSNQVAIAKANGISPLVTILDDGTAMAHAYAMDALLRLARDNVENQTQSAKHLVALLGNESTGAQRRAARVLSKLAAENPGSPVIIVNAGAISPLVTLLSSGALEVKEEAARALSDLSLNSPSTQLAIATGLVALVGSGSAAAQEHVTQLLLTLAQDADNRVAIAKAGAVQRLVQQLRGVGQTSTKAQELAAAVLANLSDAKNPDAQSNVEAIAQSNAIRPLVTLLGSMSPVAQAHAAAVLSGLAHQSANVKRSIIAEGGITPLVALLAKDNHPRFGTVAKAEAASALLYLATGSPENQKQVAEASGGIPPQGAIKLLVNLLNENNDNARMKAAGAIAALCLGSTGNQDNVDKNKGIDKLVELLAPEVGDEVRAAAAAALAVLTSQNKKIQDKVTVVGGIKPLVEMLQGVSEHAKEEAASAIGSLAEIHFENQVAVAEAGGIAPLVAVLGLSSARARAQAGKALAALALDNNENKTSIAELLVSLLGSNDQQASAKAAHAISAMALANAANQVAIAKAGGVKLLVKLLSPQPGGGRAGNASPATRRPPSPVAERPPTPPTGTDALLPANGDAEADGGGNVVHNVQKEMANAIWAMANTNEENQVAIAAAGGIPSLIALLASNQPDLHREVAGALWALAGNPGNADNQRAIAKAGGIPPLVALLKLGVALGAQETAAGALYALAEAFDNRVSIADAGGISLLVSLLHTGSEECKEQAAGALQRLVIENQANQLAIANGLVAMLAKGSKGSAEAQEHVTALLRNLAQDPENRGALAKAGAIPQLVKQLKEGSPKAQGDAAGALAQIALKSAEHKTHVTQELVGLLGSNNEAVRQRASEALRDMAAESGTNSKKSKMGAGGAAPLVNLLKDGLKDGRVEAQEYALLSLSSITDTASRVAMVEAGCIVPLISSLTSGKLSMVAQEHCAMVISGLAPIGMNAQTIKDAEGVYPLVLLLSQGNTDAKEHAATALAQLARRANAALVIAEYGGVSAFVSWLADPSLGPPEVAARALSEIALDNPDTQAQIAEEGAISPLVQMVGAWGFVTAAANPPDSPGGKTNRESGAGLDSPGRRRRSSQENASQANLLAAVSSPANPASSDSGGGGGGVGVGVGGGGGSHHGGNAFSAAAVAAAGGGSGLLGSPGRATPSGIASALKLATVAAGCLATLAKDHIVNQIIITEEGGIPPLLNLLNDKAATSKEQAQRAAENATKALWHLAGTEDNKTAIPRAGGIAPLVSLLTTGSETTQQSTAAALEALAKDHIDNQIALARAGAIEPLVALLGSESKETQEHAVSALLYLAANDERSRNAVIQNLVAVLGARSAAAQMKAAEALAVLAGRSADNRKAITAASAVEPLVSLLGDGRRVRSETPQERAAAVLADLARVGENKVAIVLAGGVKPLVMMLSSDSPDAATHAVGCLQAIAAVGSNKGPIADAGAIPPLVALLKDGPEKAQELAAGALWHLAAVGDNKQAMINAGAIPPLVSELSEESDMAREYAAGVLSALARTQGGNKKAIVAAGGIAPLIALLSDPSIDTQKNAACALWGLTEGKEGIYDREVVESGAVQPLIAMLMMNHPESRGFAAACLSCCCADESAQRAIRETGSDALRALALSPNTWLRQQVTEMLKLLELPLPDANMISPLNAPPEFGYGSAAGSSATAFGGGSSSTSFGGGAGGDFGGGGSARLDSPVGEPTGDDSLYSQMNDVIEVGPDGKQKATRKGKKTSSATARKASASTTRAGGGGGGGSGGGNPSRQRLTTSRDVDVEEQAARMKAVVAAAQAASTNMPSHVRMKFHFFSFQLDGGRQGDR